MNNKTVLVLMFVGICSLSGLQVAAQTATGLVSLDTTPWSRVFFHGRSLGETPLAEVRLPVGRQVLVCVDGEGNRHSVTVVVEADQIVRRRVQF